MPLEILGAGFGRTGTNSLRLALDRLGFGPCHHMHEVAAHPEQVPLWQAAARRPADGLERGLRRLPLAGRLAGGALLARARRRLPRGAGHPHRASGRGLVRELRRHRRPGDRRATGFRRPGRRRPPGDAARDDRRAGVRRPPARRGPRHRGLSGPRRRGHRVASAGAPAGPRRPRRLGPALRLPRRRRPGQPRSRGPTTPANFTTGTWLPKNRA